MNFRSAYFGRIPLNTRRWVIRRHLRWGSARRFAGQSARPFSKPLPHRQAAEVLSPVDNSRRQAFQNQMPVVAARLCTAVVCAVRVGCRRFRRRQRLPPSCRPANCIISQFSVFFREFFVYLL